MTEATPPLENTKFSPFLILLFYDHPVLGWHFFLVYFRFAVYTRLRGSVNAAGYRRNQRGGVRVSLHPLHHMADKAVYRVGNIPVLLGDQLQLMAHGRMVDLKQMNIRERKPLENRRGQHRDTVV